MHLHALSVVCNKSNQHLTIYDSYVLELAAKLIKVSKFENTSTTCSVTGKLFFDLEKDDDKNILYKMLMVYNCKDYSSAPLKQYKINEIYQEMTPEDEFTTKERDDRILVDIRRSKGYTDELEKLNRDDSGLAVTITLKKAAEKKLRLRVTGFSQTDYWYLLSNKAYIISYKNYNISKLDELHIIKINNYI